MVKLRRQPRSSGSGSSSADAATPGNSITGRLVGSIAASWPWIILVAGIILLATWLRFSTIGLQGLWADEIWSVNASMHGPIAAVKTTAGDTNPPLFYMLEAVTLGVFGLGDTAARILPAVQGVFATATLYFAGRGLFNRSTGAWAAALFAVSAIAVQYAQEARMYSQLMLFSALLLWVVALLIDKPTIFRAAATGVVLACLAYTHVFGYMVAPVLITTVFLLPRLRRRIGRHTLAACAFALLLFLPWVFVIPTQIHKVTSSSASGGWWMPVPDNLGNYLIANLTSFSPGQKALPSAIFIALLIIGVAAFTNPDKEASQLSDEGIRESDIAWLLAALVLVPILAGLIVAKYVTPVYTVRNTLVSLPAAYMLAVHGALKLKKPLGIAVLLLLLLFGLRSHPQNYPHNYKGEWLRATEILQADPGAGVLVDKYSAAFVLETYPKFRGLPGVSKVVFAKDTRATPAVGGRLQLGDISLPQYLAGVSEVYVVSEGKDSVAAEYMDRQTDWKLTETLDMYKPVIRRYTRTDREVVTPNP